MSYDVCFYEKEQYENLLYSDAKKNGHDQQQLTRNRSIRSDLSLMVE